MTFVSCSMLERYVNPLFEVFEEGDFMLSSFRDVEDSLTTVRIFVEDPRQAPRAAEALVRAGALLGLTLTPEVGSLRDEDWRLAYRKHFKIDVISPRLALVPEWERETWRKELKPLNPLAQEVFLDPGMAFGTGQHATTRACLIYIDTLAQQNASRSFLDVGCGSGILALAACRLGFSPVRGFDIDPDAVANANENAQKNKIPLTFVRGDLSGSSPLEDVVDVRTLQADVVAANVLGPILIRFASEIAACVKPGGELILSGILDEIYPDVREAYEKLGFREVSSRVVGEWRTGLFHASKQRGENA